YADLLAAAAEETGVTITLAPHAHQGALTQAAYDVLPEGLTVQKTPSIHHDRHQIILKCIGQVSVEALAKAEACFHETTGWHLTFEGVSVAAPKDGTGNGRQDIGAGQDDDNGQANDTKPEAPLDTVGVPLAVALSSTAQSPLVQPADAQPVVAQSTVTQP